MGTLIYGPGERYEFEDRVLAHVKIAAVIKLRRQESFLINWVVPSEHGSGRVSLWVSPATDLQFQFAGNRPPVLSKIWLEALTLTAHRTGGMEIMDEPEAAEFISQQASFSASPA